MKIDETDLKIIKIFCKNGRTNNNDIAAQLNISEGTVRNRVNKLLKSDLLIIKGYTNPNKIIDKQIIFLGIKIATSKELDKSAKEVSKLANVTSVSIITGRYDLIVELFIEPHNLINFLSNELTKVDSISSTESFVTLKSYNKWV
ncbi:MAG: hypothetical protein A2096_00755 [Spirochaetes bacterium GWF1_41_5]|nr:MAG: hypothetical protein A2096_00755 [Spirochaetes bacterium GWF1_41_5]